MEVYGAHLKILRLVFEFTKSALLYANCIAFVLVRDPKSSVNTFPLGHQFYFPDQHFIDTPISSAIDMNRSGAISPKVGCNQRGIASNAVTRWVPRSTIGW